MGRKPETTLSDLRPDWREYLLEKFGEGWSIAEVLVGLGVTQKVHARLRRDHEEYDQAFEDGMVLSEAWWVRQGRENILNNRSFNVGIWVFNLKNRFGWRDSIPNDRAVKVSILPDHIKEVEDGERFKLKGVHNESIKGDSVN